MILLWKVCNHHIHCILLLSPAIPKADVKGGVGSGVGDPMYNVLVSTLTQQNLGPQLSVDLSLHPSDQGSVSRRWGQREGYSFLHVTIKPNFQNVNTSIIHPTLLKSKSRYYT